MNTFKNILLASLLPFLIIITAIQQNKDEKQNKEFTSLILNNDKQIETSCKIKTYKKSRSIINLTLDCPFETLPLTLYYGGDTSLTVQDNLNQDFFQKDNKVVFFEKSKCLLTISGSLEFKSDLSKQISKKSNKLQYRDCLKI